MHLPQESCFVSTIPTIKTVIRKLTSDPFIKGPLTFITLTVDPFMNSLVVLMEQDLERLDQVKYLIVRLWDWQIIVEMLWQPDAQLVVLVVLELRPVFKIFSNPAFSLVEVSISLIGAIYGLILKTAHRWWICPLWDGPMRMIIHLPRKFLNFTN